MRTVHPTRAEVLDPLRRVREAGALAWSARFEQENGGVGAVHQAPRDHAARRPGADDHVVVTSGQRLAALSHTMMLNHSRSPPPQCVLQWVDGRFAYTGPMQGPPTPFMGNGKRVAVPILGGTYGFLGGSYAHQELPRRDADNALEVMGELALIRELGVRGDLRQGQFGPGLQELPGPLDAAQDDVLVRRQPGGPLELRDEVVGTEAGDRGQLLQGRATVEVLLDVLDDGAEPRPGERAGSPARGLAGRKDMPDQVDSQDGGQRLGGERAPGAGG